MRLKILRSPSCRLSFSMISISISIFMVTATTNGSSECSCGHTIPIDPSTLSTSVVSRRKIFRFSISSALFSLEKADVKIERQVTFTSMALQFPPRPSELFPVDTLLRLCLLKLKRNRSDCQVQAETNRSVFANFQEHCEWCELYMPKDVIATIVSIFNSSVCRRWSWKALKQLNHCKLSTLLSFDLSTASQWQILKLTLKKEFTWKSR